MSNDLVEQRSRAVAEAWKRIDVIGESASDAFLSAGSFTKALNVANAIRDLRKALTDEVMAPIMELMNSPLGFMTDQDPLRPSDKNPNPKPYSVAVVRDCFIEARLRGFFPVNNEMNIIAGRFYGTVTGFDRQVRNHTRVTDFKDFYEVPRVLGEAGALVKCKATWKQDKVTQTFEREFAVRINRGMGTDAIAGKAKRKLLAAVYARLTGVVTPDGETGDLDLKPAGKAATDAAPKAEDLFGGKKEK